MPEQITNSPPQFWAKFRRRRLRSSEYYQDAGLRLVNRWRWRNDWPAVEAIRVYVEPDGLGGGEVDVACRVWGKKFLSHAS